MIGMRVIKVLLIVILGLFAGSAFGQITSSSMQGRVVDDSSKSVEGAIVKATHQPSGTIYGSVTEKTGDYNIPNMRVGGPYTIEVKWGDFTRTFNDVYLSLGEPFTLNAKLGNEVLSEVVIQAAVNPLFNNKSTGASTIITSEQITTLPTLSRSILDFTRLTPQSSGQNFMGRNSNGNNFQINGANFNNQFGLSSGFPGGAQPFSIDAVDQ
ncbi:MAG: carboxypeptidase regulatory-like domain-containing protein, partial [Chitinophagia bacterium]|nr:carboxypeptidase regulatory-like domain-containing protein [Chitinophagia bacterium]